MPQLNKLQQLLKVSKRGNELIKEHGLRGWKLEIADSIEFVGKCYFHRQVIAISRFYVFDTAEEIEDTLLHEIAHALVGPEHGHDEVWQAKAIELGARPDARTEVAVYSPEMRLQRRDSGRS